MTKVRCLGLGNGVFTDVELDVIYFAEYLRGPDGTCAFCKGDPCNEVADDTAVIAQFYATNPHAETCPVCQGRPT